MNSRLIATPEENYDQVLAEANLSSIMEYNRAAGRRILKLTKVSTAQTLHCCSLVG
jgi:hypothetical protein